MLMYRLTKRVRTPLARKLRVEVAWWVLFASVLGWPISALTWAKQEPKFILGLSWLAIVFTMWEVITSSEIQEEQVNGDAAEEGQEPEGSEREHSSAPKRGSTP